MRAIYAEDIHEIILDAFLMKIDDGVKVDRFLIEWALSDI